MGQNPYGGMGGIDLGGSVQMNSGIPSDYTQLAQSMGQMPNAFASPGQQILDAQRYMALQKSIMDQMYQGYQRNSAAPGGAGAAGPNAVAQMPLYMRNYFNTFGAMANSPAGMMLTPPGGQGMLNQGGYKVGSMGSDMSPMLRQYMAQVQNQANPTQFSPSDYSNAVGGAYPQGPGSVSNGGAVNAGGGSGGGTGGGQSSGAQGYTGQGNAPGGSTPVLGGLGDIARALIPGAQALGDASQAGYNASQNQGQSANASQSPVTVNTAGGLAPRTKALILQRAGVNAIPPGQNADDFVDNILYKMLGGQ